MVPTIKIEVIDVYPTSIGHCPHINLLSHEMNLLGGEYCPLSDQALEYPKEILENHLRIAEVIKRVKNALKGIPINVTIEMVEATSLKGIFKSIRHRLRQQSAIIVNGKKVCDGFPEKGVLEGFLREEARRMLGSLDEISGHQFPP